MLEASSLEEVGLSGEVSLFLTRFVHIVFRNPSIISTVPTLFPMSVASLPYH